MPTDKNGNGRGRVPKAERLPHFRRAIEEVLEKKLSVREAARKYELPRTTLQRHLGPHRSQSLVTNSKSVKRELKPSAFGLEAKEIEKHEREQHQQQVQELQRIDDTTSNTTMVAEKDEQQRGQCGSEQPLPTPASSTMHHAKDNTSPWKRKEGKEDGAKGDEFVISSRKHRRLQPKKPNANPLQMVLRSSPTLQATSLVITPEPIRLSSSTLSIPAISSASASGSASTATALTFSSSVTPPPNSSLLQAASQGPHHAINCKVRMLGASAGSALDELSNKLILDGKVIYKLGLGQSPFPIPQCIVDELRANSHQRDYLPVAGLPSLCEDVAAYANRSLSLSFTRHDVLIGPGTKELLFLLQTVYYGDLLLPNPSCTSYAPQATIAGRNMFWLPTYAKHRWVLRPEVLEAHCVSHPEVPRILILNSPSNPTGCAYNDQEVSTLAIAWSMVDDLEITNSLYVIEKLEALAQVARKYRILVVSDELYAELHHTGEHVSMAQFYPEGTIVSGGLSKWCGAGGWRIGFWIFPTNMRWLRKHMLVMASETYTSVASPIQYAARRAFVSDCMELSTYKEKCRKTLQIIGQWCAYRLGRMDVEVQVPQGGFYLFPCFQKHRESLAKRGIDTDVRLCERLLDETGVAILPGSHFGRAPEELYVRIAYVDFRGEIAMYLINSTENLELPAIQGFIQSVCPNLDIAMHKLANWLNAPIISTTI